MRSERAYLDLTVIVSGVPVPMRKVRATKPAWEFVVETLKAGGHAHQRPQGWQLRDEAGTLLPEHQSLRALGLTHRQTLYLSPAVGVGAALGRGTDPERPS